MPEPLEEELSLDISPALTSIGSLDDALTAVIQNFQVGLASAIQSLTEATTITAQPVDIAVQADVTPAEATIQGLSNETVDIAVDADTTQAQAGLNDLATSAGGAAGGLEQVKGASTGVGVAAGLAAGSGRKLADAFGSIGEGAGAVVAGGVALTAFFGTTIAKAADAQAQLARFNNVFGDLAGSVRNINVGGLVISLDELGRKSGTTTADLENSASRIGLLGKTAEASTAQIKTTTDQILALGGTLSVQNPRLGDAAAVSDRLTTALARGGRAAAQLGLNVPTDELKRLSEQIAGAGNQVTFFDKLMAGAQIATGAFGDTLGTQFAQGAQNAQVQIRALGVALEESLIRIGTPLLGPTVDLLTSLVPIAEQVGRALGSIAQIAVPAFQVLEPVLHVVADVLGLIADGLDHIPGPLADVAAGFVLVTLAVGRLLPLLEGLNLVELISNPVFIAVAALAALGAAFDIFGGKSDAAAKSAKDFNDAVFGAGSGFQSLHDKVTNLIPDVTKFAQATIDGIDAASKLRLALDDAGGGARGMADALTGTNTHFANYENVVRRAAGVSDDLQAKFERLANGNLNAAQSSGQFSDAELHALAGTQDLTKSLDAQRKVYEAHSAAALQAFVTSGQLNQAQIDQIKVTDAASIAQGDYTKALQDANLAAQQAADAQSAANVKTAASSGALASLVESFRQGNISAETFSTTLQTNYNVSASDAKTITDALTKSLQDFADAAVKALPTAGGAIQNFASGVKTAQANLAQAVTSGANAVAQAQKQLDQTIAATSKSGGVSTAVQNAQDSLQRAQDNLARIQSQGGTNQASAITSAQGQVDAANTRLLDAQRAADARLQSQLDSRNQRVADAQKNLADVQGKSAADIKAAQDAVVKAVDPETLVKELQSNLTNIANFTKNIDTLVHEGFTSIAAELVKQGPTVAGGLAESLVDRPKIAKSLNALTEEGDKQAEQYRQHALTVWAPIMQGATATLADGTTLAFKPDLVGQMNKAVADLSDHLLKNVPAQLSSNAVLRRVGESVGTNAASSVSQAGPVIVQAAAGVASAANTAFDQTFNPDSVAGKTMLKVPAAVQKNAPPAYVATGQLGSDMSRAFENALDLEGAVKDQITLAAKAFDNTLKLDAAALTAGFRAGAAFSIGVGLGANTQANAPTQKQPTTHGAEARTSAATSASQFTVNQVFNEKVDPQHVIAELAWQLSHP
jgi:hypothetical protein